MLVHMGSRSKGERRGEVCIQANLPSQCLLTGQSETGGGAEEGVSWCLSYEANSKLADLPLDSPSPHAAGTSATATVEDPARPLATSSSSLTVAAAATATEPIASDQVHPSGNTRDVGIITDLCNDEDPDEVEILSLIQEQIPQYRLRTDSFSDFGCYSHQDWIQTPIINLDTDLDLTEEQITETLKYFGEY
ncbi:hypothetical protein ACOMHN_066964 [Nucella lapillus]